MYDDAHIAFTLHFHGTAMDKSTPTTLQSGVSPSHLWYLKVVTCLRWFLSHPVVPNTGKGRTIGQAPTGHKWATKLGFRRSNTELFNSDLCVQRRELTLPARRPTNPHISSNTFRLCSIPLVRRR
jgi:hypothetical protein